MLDMSQVVMGFETQEEMLNKVSLSLVNSEPQNNIEKIIFEYEKILEIWQAEELEKNKVK